MLRVLGKSWIFAVMAIVSAQVALAETPAPTPAPTATASAQETPTAQPTLVPQARVTFTPITDQQANRMKLHARVAKGESVLLGVGVKKDGIPQIRPTTSAQMRELADREFINGDKPDFVKRYNRTGKDVTVPIANSMMDVLEIDQPPETSASTLSASPYGLEIPVPDVGSKISRLKTSEMGSLRKKMNRFMSDSKGFFGVDFGDMASKIMGDFGRQFLSPASFWDCWDLHVQGVCWETGHGCGGHPNAICACEPFSGYCFRADALREYNWTVQQMETANSKGEDFYTPKVLAKILFLAGEEAYKLLRKPIAMGNGITTELAARGTGVITSVIPGAMSAGSLMHANIETSKIEDISQNAEDAIFDIPAEFRASNNNAEGTKTIQTRIFRSISGTLGAKLLNSIPVLKGFGPCQKDKNFVIAMGLPIWSEGSFWAMLTKPLDTSVLASAILHGSPSEFAQHIGHSLGCPIFNTMQAGVDGDMLSKPAADLQFGPFGLAINEIFNKVPILHATQQKVAKQCGRGNNGYMGQVTGASASTDVITSHEKGLQHAADEVEALVNKGSALPGGTGPADFFFGFNREKDTVQYLGGSPLSKKNGKSCKKLAYDKMHYEEEFKESDRNPSPTKDITEPQGLMSQWRKFKCCYNKHCIGNCGDQNDV